MKTTNRGTSVRLWLPVLLLLGGGFGVEYWQSMNAPIVSSQGIDGPSVLLVRGDNSANCRAIHRLVAEAAQGYGQRVRVMQIDWSADNPLIKKYQVRFLPSVVFIDAEGRKVGEVVGESPAVQRKLREALAAFGQP